MADSSSLNKLPNLSGPNLSGPGSVEKTPLEKVAETLRQPIAIAVVASLGAHGLLWFGLPLLSSDGDQPNEQRTVQVVELSPLEQARLPQSTPSTTLSKTKSKAKSTKSKTDDFLASLGIPTTPSAPPPPASTPYYTIPSDLLPASPSPLDLPSIRIPRPKPPKINFEDDPPKKSASETGIPTQEPTLPKTEDPTQKKGNAQEPLASKRASDLGTPNPAVSPEPTQDNQETTEALRDLYAFNSSDPGLQDDVALGKLKEFSSAHDISIYDWAKVEDMTTALPKEICQLKKADQEALSEAIKQGVAIGVIVSPKGKPAEIAILRSSGSKGLNKAAVEFIKNQTFQVADTTEKNNFLRFRVSFDPAQTDCKKVGALDKPTSQEKN